MYGIAYAFLPMLFYMDKYPVEYGLDMSSNGLLYLWIWQILAVLGYVVLQIVYYSGIKIGNVVFVQKYNTSSSLKALQYALIVCLIIGLLSLFLWTKAFGGITEFILVANVVRSGRAEIDNPLAFFKRPAFLVLFSSYLSLYLIKHSYNRKLNLALFVISFIASVLYLLANDGRMPMAFYFLIISFIVLGLFSVGRFTSKKLLRVFMLGSIAFLFILQLDSITKWIRVGEYEKTEHGFTESTKTEFAYILRAGQSSVSDCLHEGSPLLFKEDVIGGLMAWLPNRMKPYDFVNIWDYNTDRILRYYSTGGQQPTDLVSTSLYDLDFLGIIVLALLWGVIIRKIDLSHLRGNTPFGEVVYYSLLYTFIRIPIYSSLYYNVLSLFYLLVAYLVWKLITNVQTKKRNVLPH